MNLPNTPAKGAFSSFLWKFAMTGFGVATIYVLSFGPVLRLTTGTVSGLSVRPPPFSNSGWVDVVYGPMFRVLHGETGIIPYRALKQYLRLWIDI